MPWQSGKNNTGKKIYTDYVLEIRRATKDI